MTLRSLIPALAVLLLANQASAAVLASWTDIDTSTTGRGFLVETVSAKPAELKFNSGTVGVTQLNFSAIDPSPEPGLTNFFNFTGLGNNSGAYGSDFSVLPTDNVLLRLWTRTNDTQGDLFHSYGGTGISLTVTGGDLTAAFDGGSTLGTHSNFSDGEWHLVEFERLNGVSSFRIDSAAVGVTATDSLTNSNNAHLGIRTGGSTLLAMDITGFRVESVPEPGASSLLILPFAALLRRRRV